MIDDPELLLFLQMEQARAVDQTLNEERATALSFYRGDLFGDEVDGRSKLRTRDVAMAVDYMVTSIMRTMASGDKIVEFEATRQEVVEQEEGKPKDLAVEWAQEATERVHWNFMREQDGYQILFDGAKAGLLEKLGVFKTWVEIPQEPVQVRMNAAELDNLPAEVLADAVEIEGEYDLDQLTGEPLAVYEATIMQPGEPVFHDAAIPNDEFFIAPDARSIEKAAYVGNTARVSLADLMDMGYAWEELETLYGEADGDTQSLRDARDADRGNRETDAVRRDVHRVVTLREEYTRWWVGPRLQLVMVHRVGSTILGVKPAQMIPYVSWCPFPMPHRWVGHSLADKVLDVQVVRSHMLRQAMDNLYQANANRWLVDEAGLTANTIDDLLDVAPGGLIRHKNGAPPVPVVVPQVAVAAFNAMEIMAGEAESRTGITRMNQGLDADALNKMLCVKTPVPMANGEYKLLADIADGDLIVGSDGFAVQVSKAHVIHDPERAYRLTFASGEQIDAGGEHLWTVQTGNDKRYGKNQTVDTDTLFGMMQGKGAVYIPRVSRPQVGRHKELPLDPYMLGLWLGDGHSYAPRITTMDAEILEYVQGWAESGVRADKHQNSGKATTYYVGGLYAPLREMKLLYRGDDRDADVRGKHIPEAYFTASYEQRLELLQGLMDTDGCHHSKALNIFCQKDGQLLRDTIRLIETLGGWPSVKKLNPKGTFKHSGDHYQVTFSLSDCPFKLTRKRLGWTPPEANVTSQPIKAIERIAVKPMRCLTVAADDGLFCVGKRFTVTHNTATGTALMQASGQQIEEAVARHFANCIGELFEKKLRLMIEHMQPHEFRIDGEFREITPQNWPADMRLGVRVGLGTGNRDKRLQGIMMLKQAQAEAVMADPRLVGPEQVFNTAKLLVENVGLGTATRFFNDPAQLGPQPEQPDPAMAEIEAKKEKHQLDIQMQRDKSAASLRLQEEAQRFEQELAARKAEFEANLARERQQFEMSLQAQQVAAQQDIALRRMRSGGDLDK